MPYRTLIIGQKTSAGSGTADEFTKVLDADEVGAKAGRNSMCFGPAGLYFQGNNTSETWLALVDDDGGGTEAAGAFVFSGTATEAGTVPLYIGRKRITFSVAVGDAAGDMAAAAETAIDEVESPAAHIAPLEISPITLANPTQGFSLLEGPH